MIISRTPLRMSFAGGGSDFKGYYNQSTGSVISTTIDKYVYVLVNKRFIDSIGVKYSQVEESNDVNNIRHNLVREALKLLKIDGGVELVYSSDLLPAHHGSGLGASSSLLVGTLNALHAYKGEHVSAEQLAREACKIEIDILGSPIGKQDQYAAAYGGLNHIKFHPEDYVEVTPINLTSNVKKRLKQNLLIFYTGLDKKSEEILTEQKSKTQNNVGYLEQMVALSDELADNLKLQVLDKFGEILDTGWEFKKKLASKITNELIDSYYLRAKNAGATGGKILGSGGGGFLLLYCEQDQQEKVRRELADLKELPFEFECQGSKIIYVGS